MSEIKKHADGGTYKVIQVADTRDGWAIALTEWTTYRGALRWEVLRVAPDGVSLRLDLCQAEAPARERANHAWRQDR
jgi:hypothetical protein